MQAPRVDLYASIHKALRARLFDLCIELARCHWAQRADAAIALDAYRRTAAFLREHHAHEDEFIEPVLAPLPAELVAVQTLQHAAAESALRELDTLVAALDGPDPRTAGAALLARYHQFLIEYLQHMAHEESAIMPALWARYSDAELMAIRGRLQGSIPLPRFQEWLEIMFPALNFDERLGMLAGMKTGAPPPVFEAATNVAARVLGNAAWDALRAQLIA
jgi:hypothetical protein